ncbi:diguanylate cyclase [Bengtsoniella intestinalis]|uniref:diguanylate cyclase domain-containing protein n=1 Tax=Bengtsoniella intestinalis TaxID=3073143 RepID=UPI00391F4350
MNEYDLMEGIAASTFAQISQARGLCVQVWSKALQIVYGNQSTAQLFGADSQERYLECVSQLMPDYQPSGVTSAMGILEQVQTAFAQGNHQFYWLYCKLDGTELPCQVTLVRHEEDDGSQWVVGLIRDLTATFEGEKLEGYDYYFNNTFSNSDLLQVAVELTNEWLFVADLRTKTIQYYGNLIYQHMGQYKISDAMGDAIALGYIHPDDEEAYLHTVALMQAGLSEPVELRYRQQDGTYRYYRMLYQIIKDSQGHPVYAAGKGVDIHDEMNMKLQVEKDQLTNCYNKISTELKINHLLAQYVGQNHVLMILDIDEFKAINDNLGHYVGDHVLQEIAAGIQGLFRAGDVIGRVGGDEFIVFVPNMGVASVLEQKAKDVVKVCQRTYQGIYRDYSVSASVGIACSGDVDGDFEALYKAADKALYQSKSKGKNCYTIYNQSMSESELQGITTIDQVNRSISAFFDYDLVAAMFDILYAKADQVGIINQVLGYIGEKFGVDRVYTFETFDGGKTYDNTFEWCKEGIPTEIDSLQDMPEELVQDYFWTAQHDLIYANNLQESMKNSVAYELMARQGILSFAHAQVRREGYVSFFLGLDDCSTYRHWSEKELNSLRYIAKIMSLTIQNQRTQMTMDAMHQERLLEEQLYRSCSECLLGVKNPQQGIDKLLSAFATYYGAGRSYLFVFSPDGATIQSAYEWCAEGVSYETDGVAGNSVDFFAEWVQGLEVGGCLLLDITPETAHTPLRKLLVGIGVSAVLVVPLRGEDGSLIGFVGVDNPTRHGENVAPMASVCDVIASFLYRSSLLED